MRSLVVVGASAGGVEALRGLVGALPADLAAPVLVVLHVPPTGSSSLPAILERSGRLPVRHAADGDPLVAGEVLVAPPDRHLLVEDGHVVLRRDPQKNGHRPAVDVLFRSAARAWQGRVVAVVLSGSLDDGAAGVVAVSRRGGHCLVQDPDEAAYAAMPRAAAAVADCEVLPVADLAQRVVALASVAPEPDPGPSSATGPATPPTQERVGAGPAPADDPSGYVCPDCAEPLHAVDEGPLRRYRCRQGHVWSPESLLVRQSVALESALWMALRGLEEKAALNAELGHRARERGARRTAERFEQSGEEVSAAAGLVRGLITDLDQLTTPHDDTRGTAP